MEGTNEEQKRKILRFLGDKYTEFPDNLFSEKRSEERRVGKECRL